MGGVAAKALATARVAAPAVDFQRRLAGLKATGQPVGITRPVRSAGKLIASFDSPAWIINTGTPALTRNYTGFDALGNRVGVMPRTGAISMLKINPGTNGNESIRLQAANDNARNRALNGRFLIWVYVDVLPGYGPGEAGPSASLYLELTTAASAAFTNGLNVGFNANQLREGWNCLSFVMRNPAAYRSGSGEVEYHPFGVAATGYGTGVDADIVNNPITGIKIGYTGLPSTTSVYLDSLWTGFDSQAQIVFGSDAAGQDLVDTLPVFQKYGFIGYTAGPARIWTSGDLVLSGFEQEFRFTRQMYAAGWENINHTVNHRRMGDITSPAELLYELDGVDAIYLARGLERGNNFYASPKSSTSRLSEKVIKEAGKLIQRHARKQNVTVTPFGIDNPHYVGAPDLGSATGTGVAKVTSGVAGSEAGFQRFSQIKKATDVMVAYGDSWFPFWHGITSLGDTGSGEDLTGDNLLITRSAITKAIEYWGQLDAAGALRVRDGMTGFYYGSGR